MKSKTARMILTTVITLISFETWSAATPASTAAPATTAAANAAAEKKKAAEAAAATEVDAKDRICLRIDNEQKRKECFNNLVGMGCREPRQKVEDARAAATAACANAGQSVTDEGGSSSNSEAYRECKEKASSCATMDNEEQSSDTLSSTFSTLAGGMTGMNMPSSPPVQDGNYRGLCMNKRDYRETARDIKQDLKEAQEKVSRINKEINEAQKDQKEDLKKIQERQNEMIKDARTDDAKMKDESRKAAEQAQATTVQAQSKMHSLNIEILQAQGALANAISKRAAMLQKLTDPLISTECLKKIEAVQATWKNVNALSQTRVIQQSRLRRDRLKSDYQNCVQEALTLREGEREATQRNIDSIEETIRQKRTEAAGLEQSVKLANANQQTAQSEQQNNAQQATTQRQQQLQQLQTESQAVSTLAQQKIANLNTQLTEAKQAVTKASNEMGSLGSRPAGEKSPTDAMEAFAKLQSAINQCPDDCCTGTAPAASRQTTPAARAQDRPSRP